MKWPIERILQESLPIVEYRLDSEPSFLGFLLSNCSKKDVFEIKRYLHSRFQKEKRCDLKLVTYNTAISFCKNPREYFHNKKLKNPSSIFFIMEQGSYLSKIDEIRENCFIIDIDYYRKINLI